MEKLNRTEPATDGCSLKQMLFKTKQIPRKIPGKKFIPLSPLAVDMPLH